MNADTNDLLAIENLNLSVRAGHLIPSRKQVLRDVSFAVPRGTATAYLGPNGAGKTSTFRILTGLCRRDAGQVIYDGVPVSSLPPGRIGFMPEQPYFYRNLTPLELLTGFARLSGLAGGEIRRRIEIWAERLEFTAVLHQRLAACSKGQVQRVGLAQALIHEPECIILDEPFSGLDPLGRECVRHAIVGEVARGATLLFSSHILDDAESLCEHVVVLNRGEVAYAGDMRTLLGGHGGWQLWIDWPEGAFPAFPDTEVRRNADGSLEVLAGSESARDEVLRRVLAEDGAGVIAVNPARRSLESAFVDLLNGGGA